MVKQISAKLANKLENFQTLNTSRDKIVPCGLMGISYSLWNTQILTYFIHNGIRQVDINLNNFMTKTTISRVSEIINILSNGRYKVRNIKGTPYLVEYDDLRNKTEIPKNNFYNIQF